MSTSASTLIFGITSGADPILLEDGLTFSRSENGFDKMSGKYLGRTNTPAAFADLKFPAASTASALGVAYSKMFCAEVSYNNVGKDLYTFNVEYMGLIGTQAVKRTVSSKSQSYTTGSVNIPGVGVVPKAQGQYINLSCEYNYVTATMPDTALASPVPPGGAGTLPAQPANPFIPLPTTPIYNYPSGWIREGIDVDMINGTSRTDSIFLIKESWVYVYPYMPG